MLHVQIYLLVYKVLHIQLKARKLTLHFAIVRIMFGISYG